MTESDAYGDFMLHGLKENSAAYRIEISDDRFSRNTVELDLKKDDYLGRFSWKANRAARPNINLN